MPLLVNHNFPDLGVEDFFEESQPSSILVTPASQHFAKILNLAQPSEVGIGISPALPEEVPKSMPSSPPANSPDKPVESSQSNTPGIPKISHRRIKRKLSDMSDHETASDSEDSEKERYHIISSLSALFTCHYQAVVEIYL